MPWTAFLAAVVAGGLCLSACGGSDDSDDDDCPAGQSRNATTNACETTSPETSNPDDEWTPPEFGAAEATGKVHGAAFTLLHAFAEPSGFTEGQISLTLLGYEPTGSSLPCWTFPPDDELAPRYWFDTPNATGDYTFNKMPGKNMYQDHPIMAISYEQIETDGTPMTINTSKARIVLDSITDTKVTGKIVVEYDADNFVNGTFSATYCPD